MAIQRLQQSVNQHARLLLALYWPALAVMTHWPNLDVTGGRNAVVGGVFEFDKVFHVLGFGMLAYLLLSVRPLGRAASARLTAAGGLLIAIVYAAVDEYTQRWFARDPSFSDLTASLIGIISVVILWLTPVVAAVSGPRSWRIVLSRFIWIIAAPLLTVVTVLPVGNQIVPRVVEAIDLSHTGLDKRMHFTLTMLLTWLLAAGAPAGRRRPRLGALATILLMVASAPSIELVQRQMGRDFELADIFAGESGLLAGLSGWAATLLVWAWVRDAAGRRIRGGLRDASGQVRAGEPADVSARTTVAGGAARATFVGHALLVGGLTLLSRVTGLVRDAVLAAAFGLGPVADAFFIGFLVPNLFRRLFGEGALSAAFIPHYAQLLKRDRELARRFATLCLTLLTVVLSGLTLLGEFGLWAAHAAAGGALNAHTALALRLTAIMLPYMPLICLVALIGGVLQVHKRFGPPAATPILLNLTMIGAALWAVLGGGRTSPAGMERAAVVVAAAVVAAGVGQLAWQAATLGRETGLSFSWTGVGASFRSMVVMMGPMLIALAVFQINALLDSIIAFGLSGGDGGGRLVLPGLTVAYPIHSGAVAALQWAQRLYQFPLGVFGIAVATAIFPALAKAANEGEPRAAGTNDAFVTTLRQGLRLTLFIGLPASVGLILLRLPLVRVVYERGEFSLDDAQRVAGILAGYAGAVWAYAMTHVITRAFYALKDSKTPLKISTAMVGLNLVLNLLLIWPLGAAGLAWSTAVSAVGQVVLLLLAIRRRAAAPVDRSVIRGWGRTIGLTIVMTVVLGPIMFTLDLEHTSLWLTAALVLALVGLGAAVVLGGGYFTGAEELTWLTSPKTGE